MFVSFRERYGIPESRTCIPQSFSVYKQICYLDVNGALWLLWVVTVGRSAERSQLPRTEAAFQPYRFKGARPISFSPHRRQVSKNIFVSPLAEWRETKEEKLQWPHTRETWFASTVWKGHKSPPRPSISKDHWSPRSRKIRVPDGKSQLRLL